MQGSIHGDCLFTIGFRPGRNAQEALAAVREGLKAGLRVALDADRSHYFDPIPPDILVAKSYFRPPSPWPSPPVGGRGDKRKELLANAIS